MVSLAGEQGDQGGSVFDPPADGGEIGPDAAVSDDLVRVVKADGTEADVGYHVANQLGMAGRAALR